MGSAGLSPHLSSSGLPIAILWSCFIRRRPRNDFEGRRNHFHCPAKMPWNSRLVSTVSINQRGSGHVGHHYQLVLSQACKKYLAAARKQRELTHLWAW